MADAGGRVTGNERGLAAVTVRYLDFVQSVYFTVIRPVEGFAAAWKAPPENNYVDKFVNSRLKQLQFIPGELCDDATFVRRIHLDLTGLLPTADRTRAFLADVTADKRAMLIDALLATEEFARFWAQKEADLYRVNPQVLDEELLKIRCHAAFSKGRAALFNEWLVEQWRQNAPYDRHVRELLTAIGDTHHGRAVQLLRSHSQAGRHLRSHGSTFHGLAHQLRQVPQSPVRELDPGRLLPHRRRVYARTAG